VRASGPSSMTTIISPPVTPTSTPVNLLIKRRRPTPGTLTSRRAYEPLPQNPDKGSCLFCGCCTVSPFREGTSAGRRARGSRPARWGSDPCLHLATASGSSAGSGCTGPRSISPGAPAAGCLRGAKGAPPLRRGGRRGAVATGQADTPTCSRPSGGSQPGHRLGAAGLRLPPVGRGRQTNPHARLPATVGATATPHEVAGTRRGLGG
jgi:hypothetical protein